MTNSVSGTTRRSSSMFLILVLVFAATLYPALFRMARAETDDCVVTKVEGSVSKVCQLIGDFDKDLNEPTTSLTYTRYGVAGTDLGVSFEHNNEIMFLFGDTVGRNTYPFSGRSDSFAYTIDSVPDDGLNLTFYTGAAGKFLPPWVGGISQGAFEVPMEGVEINGEAYVFFTINHTEEQTMGGSVLAKFNDATLNFTYLYTFSTSKFMNVHTAKVNNSLIQGLPESDGDGLLIWGSGEYRHSDPYLAYMPLQSIEDKSALRYFAGLANNGTTIWSKNEFDAKPLFHDPVVGELCVSWNPYLDRWIMLYSGVSMRSSPLPWGNWSSKQTLFSPYADDGYGYFMHWPGHDNITDLARDNEWGGAYGPYIIDKFTRGNDESSTIYFTMSTWNPYTTVLMKAELEKTRNAVPELPSTAIVLILVFVSLTVALCARYSKRFYRSSHENCECD
jgi:hypothetical protein